MKIKKKSKKFYYNSNKNIILRNSINFNLRENKANDDHNLNLKDMGNKESFNNNKSVKFQCSSFCS